MNTKLDAQAQRLLLDILEIIRRLRAPDGCPWDKEQSPDTLKKYLLEEAFELVDAIDSGQAQEAMEELGDLTFLVLFIAELYREQGDFHLADSLETVKAKMIRRHPHIFGDVQVSGTQDVVANWQAIKSEEAKDKGRKKGVLGDLPRSMPALQKSFRLGERASRIGFDWPSPDDVWEKVQEECLELRQAISSGRRDEIFEEMGDLLFTISNLSRKLGINPEEALRGANDKFQHRFNLMEAMIEEAGKDIHGLDLDELDDYWEKAKKAG